MPACYPGPMLDNGKMQPRSEMFLHNDDHNTHVNTRNHRDPILLPNIKCQLDNKSILNPIKAQQREMGEHDRIGDLVIIYLLQKPKRHWHLGGAFWSWSRNFKLELWTWLVSMNTKGHNELNRADKHFNKTIKKFHGGQVSFTVYKLINCFLFN